MKQPILRTCTSSFPFSINWFHLCLSVFICGAVCLQLVAPATAKEKADLLVTGGTVVTMDAQRRVIEDGAVAVVGDSIVAVGTSAEIEGKYEAGKTIDAHGAIVMPGLINGHAHAAMSLFRGIADDLSLDDWLHKYIFPAEARNVTEDFVAWGTRLGILEMLRGGITTYADMYYFEDAVARVTKEAGMRGVLGETIIDFPAPDNKTVPQALEYTQKYLDHWKGDALIVAAVAPHSMYTCSEKTLQDAAALARRNHAPILIHIAEAPFELEQSRNKYGLTPVAYLARAGVLGPDVVGAHCIWVDHADIATLAHFGVGCIHNPSSNMKTAAGVMPVSRCSRRAKRSASRPMARPATTIWTCSRKWILRRSCKRLTGWILARCPRSRWSRWRRSPALARCTSRKQIGSLEAGKKADLILVDTTAPHATPMYNVYSQLVYALKASDVKTVIIGGKIVMQDRQMLTLNEKEILAKAQEYKKQIAASLVNPAAN